ncbi:MAG: hypothetical protein K6E68_07510 [Lachnospiraceae bacterium]|nr:hypothetical protein [Lachnospiraceae bacterium]
MDIQIITSVIEAGGVVAAALVASSIAVIGGRNISRAFASRKIMTYKEAGYDARHIMNPARDCIYVVAEIGNDLWEKRKRDFVRYLDSGVNIYWLIANQDNFSRINQYIESEVDDEKRKEIIKEMLELQDKDTKGKFILRSFDDFIASSYIAVDIDETDFNGNWKNSSVVHDMPYRYKMKTSEAPIVDIYANKNVEVFEKLAESIKNMWGNGKPICTEDIQVE